MAYVTITKDLTEVKDKVAFGLTKRQIVCFSLGGIAGVGTYFLTRHSLGNDLALLLLIALAAPFMLFGLYEKNGQPLEKILKNIIRVRLLAPAARPYQTNNRFLPPVRLFLHPRLQRPRAGAPAPRFHSLALAGLLLPGRRQSLPAALFLPLIKRISKKTRLR